MEAIMKKFEDLRIEVLHIQRDNQEILLERLRQQEEKLNRELQHQLAEIKTTLGEFLSPHRGKASSSVEFDRDDIGTELDNKIAEKMKEEHGLMKKAIELAIRATEEDKNKNYKEAVFLYNLCVELFLYFIKYEVHSEKSKEAVVTKMASYYKRSREIQYYLSK